MGLLWIRLSVTALHPWRLLWVTVHTSCFGKLLLHSGSCLQYFDYLWVVLYVFVHLGFFILLNFSSYGQFSRAKWTFRSWHLLLVCVSEQVSNFSSNSSVYVCACAPLPWLGVLSLTAFVKLIGCKIEFEGHLSFFPHPFESKWSILVSYTTTTDWLIVMLRRNSGCHTY